MPPDARASFNSGVPLEAEGAEAAYEQFLRDVLPYTNGNHHPRFWGWVQGTGTPLGMWGQTRPSLAFSPASRTM